MDPAGPRLADLIRLLGEEVCTAPPNRVDDQQAIREAADKCQALLGSSLRRATVLNELATFIDQCAVPRSPHACYLLQSIWLRTLEGILTAPIGRRRPTSSRVLKAVVECLHAAQRFGAPARDSVIPPWPQNVIAAIQYIGRCLGEPNLSLNRVAAEVGVSHWYLDRQLRRHVGLSFTPILRALRATQAMRLIESTTFSVKEIAAMLGYNYMTTFDRHFKRVHGVTPMEWRKNAASQQRAALIASITPSSNLHENGVQRYVKSDTRSYRSMSSKR